MKVSIYTRGCSPILGLEESIGEAFDEALGPFATDIGQVDVFLERHVTAPQPYLMQVNMRPYGTLGRERLADGSSATLARAVRRFANRALYAVNSRVRMEQGLSAGV